MMPLHRTVAMRICLTAAWIGAAGCASLGGETAPIAKTADGASVMIDGATGLVNFDVLGDANWTASDGAVQASAGGKSASFLVSKSSYGDFVMMVEFWASPDANSGVFFRCADPKAITDTSCYEANIFDQRPDPTYGTGAIVNVAKVAPPMPRAGGQWNTYEITAKGSRLRLVLNGQATVEVDDARHASGPVALQWGKGTIRFRKVTIRAL